MSAVSYFDCTEFSIQRGACLADGQVALMMCCETKVGADAIEQSMRRDGGAIEFGDRSCGRLRLAAC